MKLRLLDFLNDEFRNCREERNQHVTVLSKCLNFSSLSLSLFHTFGAFQKSESLVRKNETSRLVCSSQQ